MPEKTIDVDVAGSRYQIGQMTAQDASWVVTLALTKMMPSGIEKALASKAGAVLPKRSSSITEEEFNNIQNHALAVVRRYETSGAALPVFVKPNRWAVKDLEYDVVAVIALTVNSLVHNLSPFFKGDGLLQIIDSVPGLAGLFSSITPQ